MPDIQVDPRYWHWVYVCDFCGSKSIRYESYCDVGIEKMPSDKYALETRVESLVEHKTFRICNNCHAVWESQTEYDDGVFKRGWWDCCGREYYQQYRNKWTSAMAKQYPPYPTTPILGTLIRSGYGHWRKPIDKNTESFICISQQNKDGTLKRVKSVAPNREGIPASEYLKPKTSKPNLLSRLFGGNSPRERNNAPSNSPSNPPDKPKKGPVGGDFNTRNFQDYKTAKPGGRTGPLPDQPQGDTDDPIVYHGPPGGNFIPGGQLTRSTIDKPDSV